MAQDSSQAVRKPRPTAAWMNRFVRDNRDMILTMYADELLSFKEICARIMDELGDWDIPPSMLRFSFLCDPFLRGAYDAANVDRAHSLAEEVLGHAKTLAIQGEHGKAADIKFKLASKYSPRHYGEKIDVQPLPADGASIRDMGMLTDAALESLIQRKIGHEERAA